MNKDKLFEEYLRDLNPEHWRNFPKFMWDLGFEMDCYKSAPDIPERKREDTEKQVQDCLLDAMNNWSTQEVGNYIFSRYRELTHWSDFGYPEEKGAYFFKKAFPILKEKLLKDWDARNTIPSLELFTKHVVDCLDNKNLKEFAKTEEGSYYINQRYHKYLQMYDEEQITAPMFCGRLVREMANDLEGLY